MLHALDEAPKAEADRQRDADAGTPTPEYVKPEYQRVLIILNEGANGDAGLAWLKTHDYSNEGYERGDKNIIGAVETLRLPELIEVEGVFRVWEALENDPAN